MSRSAVLFFAVFLVTTATAAQQPAPPRAEVADRIVAVVGDSIVLKSDIDLEILQLRQSGQAISDSVALFKRIVERRAGELVLLQAAARDTALRIPDEQVNSEVQRELDSRRQQFRTEAEFTRALQSAGLTIEELRRNLSSEVRSKLLLREYVRKVQHDRHPPPVTDEAIKKYFEANKASFGARPATVTFTQLVIAPKASDSARASARKQAEEILQKVGLGGDFESLAKQYSQDPATREKGGDLGWFRAGSMVREFDEVVFALRPGDVSRLVETSFGFHIIKLEKVRGAERQARHILIIPTVTAEDAERMRTFATEIAEKIRAGAGIDSLIKAIGDPNELSHIGPYPVDKLPQPYGAPLAGAKVGDIVGPIELPGAAGSSKFAIVKISDAKPAGEFSLDDPAFRENLRDQIAENAAIEELIRDLKRKTLVEYRY